MSEGAILDLEERIRAELDRLREARPDLYAISATRLGGWDVAAESGDYWLEVQVGHQWRRVTEWDDWETFKWSVERPGESFPKPPSPVFARLLMLPGKPKASAVQRPELSPWIVPDRLTWGKRAVAELTETESRRVSDELGQIVRQWVAMANARLGREEWVIDVRPNSCAPSPSVGRSSSDCTDIVLRHLPAGRFWRIGDAQAWSRLKYGLLESGRPIMSICPHCAAKIRPERLERHLGKCPRRDRAPARATAAIRPDGRLARPAISQIGEPRSGRRGLTSEDRGFGDPLDATKDLGYRARDHGRFGSPSIHDGYSDEDRA